MRRKRPKTRPKLPLKVLEPGPIHQCEHPRMTECCPGCGHWSCPDCDLSWDDNAQA